MTKTPFELIQKVRAFKKALAIFETTKHDHAIVYKSVDGQINKNYTLKLFQPSNFLRKVYLVSHFNQDGCEHIQNVQITRRYKATAYVIDYTQGLMASHEHIASGDGQWVILKPDGSELTLVELINTYPNTIN